MILFFFSVLSLYTMSRVSSLVLVVLALTAVFFAGNMSAVYKVAKGQVKSAMRKPMTMHKMAPMTHKMAPAARIYVAPAYRSVATGPLTGLEHVKTYSPAMVAGHRVA